MKHGSPIERYVLYGEPVREIELNFMHVEPIRVRSGRFEWTIEPHSHSELHQVLLVTAGGGVMRAEAASAPIEPPALVVVPSGTVHAFKFDRGTDGWVASIAESMVTQISGGDAGVLGLFVRAHCVNGIAEAAAATILEAFACLGQELVWTAPARKLAIQAELLRILVSAARVAEHDGATGAAASMDAALTERFRRLIEQDFRRAEPVSVYAGKLGVSDDRLLAACNRRFGEPPIRVIHRRIVLEAQRWLIYTHKSVAEISHELGFSDAAYFSRFFKKMTGRTPREFRALSCDHPGRREREN